MAPPTAAPPGTTLAMALEASWAVAATNHDTWGRAVRVSFHWQAKLPASSGRMTTNHHLMAVSLGICSHTSSSWGSRK